MHYNSIRDNRRRRHHGRDRACPVSTKRTQHGEMVLNDFGQIAYDEWAKLPERFPNMILDVFQIMPNNPTLHHHSRLIRLRKSLKKRY